MKTKKLIIILDAAHGSNVAGKRSPDGKHLEYKWSRMIIGKLRPLLTMHGFSFYETVVDDVEPGLRERVRRANAFPGNSKHKLLISLHNNAAGDGSEWLNARGVEIYTSIGKTNSDVYADIIMNTLHSYFPMLIYRKDMSDGDSDKEANFTVLMGNYSAVLLEWLFMDNKNDVLHLSCDQMNDMLASAITDACLQIDGML